MTDADAVREMLQYRLIRAVFTRSIIRQHEIALKGGFAMRALFGSMRATKDIDLQQDGAAVPLRRLQTMMREAIGDALKNTGMTDVAITEPKQTDTVARWKINGRSPAGSQVHLTIEVSRRGMPHDHLAQVPGPPGACGTDVDVLTYDRHAMAAAKTIALVSTPQRVAIRDIWDLDILISMRAEPPLDMIAAFADEDRIRLLYDKLEMMSWDDFRNEVAPYLDTRTRLEFTAADFETMKIRVGLTVEQWLRQAAAQRPADSAPAPAGL